MKFDGLLPKLVMSDGLGVAKIGNGEVGWTVTKMGNVVGR